MRHLLAISFIAGLLCIPPPASAAEPDPDRVALNALREELVAAVVAGDVENILSHLHPDVIVTWQNSEVCRGREAVRKFYQTTVDNGKTKAFKGYIVPPTPDELTLLYSGNTTGVAYGHNVSRFVIAGKELELPNRWTATLVKQDGRWQIASYHVSVNVLDNPIFNSIKKAATFGFPIMLTSGLATGFLIGRRAKTSPAP